jgi:hypothetical protein
MLRYTLVHTLLWRIAQRPVELSASNCKHGARQLQTVCFDSQSCAQEGDIVEVKLGINVYLFQHLINPHLACKAHVAVPTCLHIQAHVRLACVTTSSACLTVWQSAKGMHVIYAGPAYAYKLLLQFLTCRS